MHCGRGGSRFPQCFPDNPAAARDEIEEFSSRASRQLLLFTGGALRTAVGRAMSGMPPAGAELRQGELRGEALRGARQVEHRSTHPLENLDTLYERVRTRAWPDRDVAA
jgi:hypothetical protein